MAARSLSLLQKVPNADLPFIADEVTFPPLWFTVALTALLCVVFVLHGSMLGGLWLRRHKLTAGDAAVFALFFFEWAYATLALGFFVAQEFSYANGSIDANGDLELSDLCFPYVVIITPLVVVQWLSNVIIAFTVHRNGVETNKPRVEPRDVGRMSLASVVFCYGVALASAVPQSNYGIQQNMTYCVMETTTTLGLILTLVIAVLGLFCFAYTAFAFYRVLQTLKALESRRAAAAEGGVRPAASRSRETPKSGASVEAEGATASSSTSMAAAAAGGATAATVVALTDLEGQRAPSPDLGRPERSHVQKPLASPSVQTPTRTSRRKPRAARPHAREEQSRRAFVLVAVLVGTFVFTQTLAVFVLRLGATGTLKAAGGDPGYVSDLLLRVNYVCDGVAYFTLSPRYREGASRFFAAIVAAIRRGFAYLCCFRCCRARDAQPAAADGISSPKSAAAAGPMEVGNGLQSVSA